jgi:factor associated with neutral sphingomyelinase activation
LKDPEIYRDLSKPIGAINPKRLTDFRERYAAMPTEEKFMYGTHYSTPAYVISFLVRKNPLHMLKLQSGNFDNPNRLFFSINKEWRSALDNPGNVRELTPEFYMNDPSFLTNTLGLTLGLRANKKVVSVSLT